MIALNPRRLLDAAFFELGLDLDVLLPPPVNLEPHIIRPKVRKYALEYNPRPCQVMPARTGCRAHYMRAVLTFADL